MLSQFYKFVYIIINDFMLLWTTTFLSDKLNLSLHHQYQKDNPGFRYYLVIISPILVAFMFDPRVIL